MPDIAFQNSTLASDSDNVFQDPTINSVTVPDNPAENIKTETLSVKILDWAGAIITFNGMVPPGILGFLLTDKIILHFAGEANATSVPIAIVRVGADLFMFVAAEEGKRRLVRFFNTEEFKQFGDSQWWKKTFGTRWTVKEILSAAVNTAFTVNASSVFAGIAWLSLESISALLSAYKTPVLDVMATIAKHNAVKAFFMSQTFAGNVPFFMGLHKRFVNQLLRIPQYIIEHPNHRQHRHAILPKIHAVQKRWKDLCEAKDDDNKLSILNTLNNTEDEAVLLHRVINCENDIQFIIPNESWFEFFFKNSLASFFTILGIIGLYNFLDMTKITDNIFHVGAIAPVTSWMDYFSVSGIAITSIYPTIYNLAGSLFYDRNYNVGLIPEPIRTFITIFSFTMCALGGAPNAYQSLVDKEPVISAFIAALSSFLIEYNGFMLYSQKSKIDGMSEKDPTVRQAYDIDRQLQGVADSIGPGDFPEGYRDYQGSTTILSGVPGVGFFSRAPALLPTSVNDAGIAPHEGSPLLGT